MPLTKGKSRATICKNISTMEHEGKPAKQAQAIAMDIARRAGMTFPKREPKRRG